MNIYDDDDDDDAVVEEPGRDRVCDDASRGLVGGRGARTGD